MLFFKFRLAAHLGKTVRELDNVMTMTELRQWMAFSGLWPFGEDAADMRHARTCQTIASFAFGFKKKKRTLKEFLVFNRHHGPATPAQQVRRAFRALSMMNIKKGRGKDG